MNIVKKYTDFENNITVIRASEREFEIMGQCIKNIKREDANINISDHQKIIGLRNMIAHEYDAIEPVPILKQEINSLLNKN